LQQVATATATATTTTTTTTNGRGSGGEQVTGVVSERTDLDCVRDEPLARRDMFFDGGLFWLVASNNALSSLGTAKRRAETIGGRRRFSL